MKFLSLKVLPLLILVISTKAQTAVLFGGSGAVGSEVLKSLLDSGCFDEVIAIGRKSYPKVDEIISNKKEDGAPKVTTLTIPDLNSIASYDEVEKEFKYENWEDALTKTCSKFIETHAIQGFAVWSYKKSCTVRSWTNPILSSRSREEDLEWKVYG